MEKRRVNGVKNISGSRKRGARRNTQAMLLFMATLGAWQWGGCSVQKHYDLLSKFFDGVPDPNSVNAYMGAPVTESATYSEHQPYTEEACFECHTDINEMLISKDDSSICMKCHEGITEQYPVMHGAVTGIACLMCHNPHLSPLLNLLRDNSSAMCLQCHEVDPEKASEPHQDTQRSCIECHNAHGGDAPFFLHTQRQSDDSSSSISAPQKESQSEDQPDTLSTDQHDAP